MMNPADTNIAKNKSAIASAKESMRGTTARGRLSTVKKRNSRREPSSEAHDRVRSVNQPQKK